MDLPQFHESDKYYHATAGAITQVFAEYAADHLPKNTPRTVRVLVRYFPVVALAGGKEWYDHNHADAHSCDARDFFATLGGAAAVTVSIHLRW